MGPESVNACCPPSSVYKLILSPIEPVVFFLWDRIKFRKNGVTQFEFVNSIHMNNDWSIMINFRKQSIIEKCTEEEIEKYFDK